MQPRTLLRILPCARGLVGCQDQVRCIIERWDIFGGFVFRFLVVRTKEGRDGGREERKEGREEGKNKGRQKQQQLQQQQQQDAKAYQGWVSFFFSV